MSERKWRSVEPPSRAPKVEVNEYGQPRLPQVPGNAHLNRLSQFMAEKAHSDGTRFLTPHVDASGNKCPQCFPPRKTRAV